MDMTPHFPIYMDYGATTPVDQRVVDAMIPWLREHFGNPASRSHAWGWEAEAAVEKAREEVAALAGVGVTWYTMFESGTAGHVSREVVDSVARVLRLDEGERAHLQRLADGEPRARGGRDVDPVLLGALTWIGAPA